MAIQKSDFIIVDYTGKVKETGEVFDTTSEEIAKENKLYKEGDIYEPRLVVVGEGWVLKALDDALQTFKLKKETCSFYITIVRVLHLWTLKLTIK